MSLFLLRDVNNNDLPYILDIDVKCFEMPYPIEAWRFLATDAHIKVATYNHKVIGFTVYQFESSEDEGGPIDTMKIGKLAIKEQYRGIGAGRRLMRHVFQHAHEIQCKYVRCAVAEHLIYNNKKLLRFLQHWKFEAVGLRKAAMEMYGEKIDQIEFRAKVTDQIKVLG